MGHLPQIPILDLPLVLKVVHVYSASHLLEVLAGLTLICIECMHVYSLSV